MFKPASTPVTTPVRGQSDQRPATADRTPLLAASWPRLCHDLRTPLNAILGNAELLLDGSVGPLSREARACVGDVQAAGEGILRQVQALLDLCRALTAPASIAGAPLDLLALLRAQATALEVAVPLQLAPADARLVVRGDAAWLGTLAAALLELRRSAAPSGGALRVTLGRAPASGAILCLSWVDFQPDQLAALPIALIDAILDLHEGMVALSADALRLYWPASRLVQLEPCALLPAHSRKSV
jgi:signal transduction histidine kinase